MTYAQLPVQPEEQILGIFTANRTDLVGAQLLVTNCRLLLGTLDVSLAEEILAYVSGKVGGPDLAKAFALLSRIPVMQPLSIALVDVANVRPGKDAGWSHPPTLIVDRRDGRAEEIGILAGIHKTIHDPANNVARDQAVTLIKELLGT